MALFSAAPPFIWSANANGLAIRFSNPKHYAKAKKGRADDAGQLGLVRMQMLAECGQAEVREVDGGIFIAAADAVRLDMDIREGFSLPPPWPGGLRLRTESVPQSSSFGARLGLVDEKLKFAWSGSCVGRSLRSASKVTSHCSSIRGPVRVSDLARCGTSSSEAGESQSACDSACKHVKQVAT
jgi:hypothetical protein